MCAHPRRVARSGGPAGRLRPRPGQPHRAQARQAELVVCDQTIDSTYVPTGEGWRSLAAVLDLGSRRCVGWARRDTLDAELAVSALAMAITMRRPEAGRIHHSDRGSQYACAEYRAVLAAHGMRASMSRKAHCWDNAVAESCFATLELEVILDARWQTRDEARRAIFRYIETWYNRERRHSTLDYVSPAAYEERLRNAA